MARPATPPACAPLPTGDLAQHAERSHTRILWALLLARIYQILPLRGVSSYDRLLYSAHKIHLEGESMRKRAANNKTGTPNKTTSAP